MVEPTYTVDSLNLSLEERDLFVNEMSERMKDIIFMQARAKVAESLKLLEGVSLTSEDHITITYDVHYVIGDIIQIIGRDRRTGKISK